MTADEGRADAAALSYLCIRLRGKASRLRRRSHQRLRREPLTLNERPLGDRHAEQIEAVPAPDWERRYEQVGCRMALRKAMSCLTQRESALIYELFWSQKTVGELCSELCVSKNSVLKMKRNAFRKLRRNLSQIGVEAAAE